LGERENGAAGVTPVDRMGGARLDRTSAVPATAGWASGIRSAFCTSQAGFGCGSQVSECIVTHMRTKLSTADERRPLVIEAAIAAFARAGYRGTTVADVATEAGISSAYVPE
jgi:hypothetical protein